MEDKGEPRGEEDEGGQPNHPDGCIEDEEKRGDGKDNTPEEHGLGETEKKGQILETIGVVPAFGKVIVLRGGGLDDVREEEMNTHTPSPADP